MSNKMSISEMTDALRQLRNLANATKIGLQASGQAQDAAPWERGAQAVQQALALLEESQRLVGSLSFLIDQYKDS